NYEAFQLLADPDHVMIVYTAEPGSPTWHALQSLARS
ncbi:MAG: hypothetical protein JWM12_3829, partial [Ilumatobacteraceae bacterium]|nr:hypothetical protein [Ilumatobacteraceae bacterium]